MWKGVKTAITAFLRARTSTWTMTWKGFSLEQPKHGSAWITILRKERGQFPAIDVAYLPTPCMHCDDAPCVKMATNGAVYKRSDGIVLIDPEKAEGQKDIVKACPYGAGEWNEEKGFRRNVPFALTCSTAAGRSRGASRLVPPGRCEACILKTRK